MTLRRGKAVEYRQGPVKATGPGPPFFRSVSPRAGNPGHAGPTVPPYPDRPSPTPILPHQLPQAVHSSNPMA